MKMHLLTAAVFAALVAGSALAEKKADKLVSGPQAGEKVPGPFHPLNVNGENAGEKFCLYCANGEKPVAMVFARETSPVLASLIKKIDAVNEKQGRKMGSFVVFLGEEDALRPKLEKLAKDSGLQKTVLAIDNPAGPKEYNVAKDADVTVVLYVDHVAKANYAFKKGQLNEKAVSRIVEELPKKILEQ